LPIPLCFWCIFLEMKARNKTLETQIQTGKYFLEDIAVFYKISKNEHLTKFQN